MLNTGYLYGLENNQLIDFQGHQLQSDTAQQLMLMQTAAAKDNISLQICSAYRDLPRQLAIWNAKAKGQRAVLDARSQPIDIRHLSEDQLIDAILLWSALPGTSRHHWGTDIDVYDAHQMSRKQLQLIPSEYQADGPCHALHSWLTRYCGDFGFYFPFQAGLSGVSPEPWHLSYYPKANDYLAAFDPQSLATILSQQPIALKNAILARLEHLVSHYVFHVAPSPAG